MFFTLSKVFWMLAAPLNGLWVLLGLGVGLRLWWEKFGNFLIKAFIALFLIFGFFPIGHNMMVHLETQYQRPNPMPMKVDGIIVLGGSFSSYISQKTGYLSLNGNIDRMIDFILLSKQYPEAKLVFAGGSGNMFQPKRKEADDAKVFLDALNIPSRRIIFERESRNTFENVSFTQSLVKPKPEEKWVVVTSAFHMPRTMAVFEQAQWTVIPYPSDPKTDGTYKLWPQTLTVANNFFLLSKALREWVGMIAYGISGKSDFPDLWGQDLWAKVKDRFDF